MSNAGTSTRQRQEDELEVVKAIYVGDVKELGDAEPTQPLRFMVRLLPQRGSSGGGVNHGHKVPTFLVIHVTVPPDYPQRGPVLRFKEHKGLSSQEISDLETELNDIASEYVANGQEMLYQLLSHAETYLYTHQKRSIGSFHDEMVMRQKQLEEKNLRKQIDLKERERMAIKEEILRKQSEEREELKKIKERRSQIPVTAITTTTTAAEGTSPSPSPNSSPIKGDGFSSLRGRVASKRRFSAGGKRRLRSNSEESDVSVSETSDLVVLEFMFGKISTLLYRGEILGKSERGTTVYAGMSSSGNLVAIVNWKFVAKIDKKGKELKSISTGAGDALTIDGVMKQIHSFELEMNLLHKLEHPNLVLYFGMKSFSPIDEPGTLSVYLTQEFVKGTSLQSFLNGALAVDIALVRHCAKGVLEGLKYLHDNDIVHRYLRDTSIFLDSSGCVRITDYGVERKICEFYQAFNKLPDVPDKFPPSIGRGGKKGDIYRFGVILLSVINGSCVQNPPEIPNVLPPELQDFFRKCLTPIEHSRYSATDLLDHEFLKLPLFADSPLKLQPKMDENIQTVDEENDDEESDIPQALPLSFKGHSRVQSEFQSLKFLGKGGFGEVLKVKNKLDGRIYALKRIKLNPKNKQLNKKITREVKLLSQLNHENVVRYFNSWIETVIESDDEASTTADSISVDATKDRPNVERAAVSVNKLAVHFQSLFKKQQNSLGLVDNIEDLAPAMGGDSSDWGESEPALPQQAYNTDDESDETSEDEDDLFGTSFRRITMDDSDEVVFERSELLPSRSVAVDANSTSEETNVSKEKQSTGSDVQSASLSLTGFLRESQFLYIQMEYCEKSTLKTAIDNNLCEDLDRAWRLFREIVEGLVHIHQQGMIHRDLKPANIFINSFDNVKIGDLGLATSSIIPKRQDETMQDLDLDLIVGQDHGQSFDFTDETRTGQIGTALYVAPELIATGQKASYNQKVDIYSLGIMFFEMFYHPAQTEMERVRVIVGLRQRTITFPKDFDQTLFPQVTHITKWLLDHQHTKRPTSLELLQSDYLPPPHLEEAELRDIFSRTLRSSKTKSYKYLVASCFQQEVSPVEDATYDMDGGKNLQICRNSPFPSGSVSKCLYFMQRVKRVIYQVFERHGATEVHTPLLLPKSALYENIDNCVDLMSHSGVIVGLPYDLRLPFARYVGRYGINQLKRFTIEKVFRERKVYGLHPRELIECAFDIIDSAQGSLISDAEVLSVVFEIVNELPWLRSRNCTIRLGHTKLLQGVFLHHAVDEKHYTKITKLLSEVKNDRDSKQQIQTHMCSLGLSDHFVTMLLQLMDVEGSFSKISSMLKGIMKRKGEAASCIKEALHELEILISNIETFGMKCNITVIPAMTFCSNIYSGLLFQVVCDLKRRKNKMTMDCIAAGGRYDSLIQKFRTSMYLEQDGTIEGRDDAPCGVGISISLDKLIAGYDVDEEEDNLLGREWTQKGSVDVLVCALGHYPMIKEKIDMMKELLAHGIHASILDASQTLESAEEFCKGIGAIFLVILKEGEYYNNIRVRLWEHGRFNEKKLPKPEVIEFISRTLYDGCNEQGSAPTGIMRSDSVSVKQGGLLGSEINCPLVANPHNHHIQGASGGLPAYNILILMQEREKPSHLKRKYENQVMSRITDILSKLGRQQIVEVLGIEANSVVINNLASSLPLHDKEEFSKSVVEVIEKHPRLKKYLKGICDEIFELVYEKNTSVIIIFGLADNSYRVLL